MSKIPTDITDALKAARKAKGLSQRELGERAGLPQSHVSKIEAGQVDLQTSSLVELARALDLEVILVKRQSLPSVNAAISATSGGVQRTDSPHQTHVRSPESLKRTLTIAEAAAEASKMFRTQEAAASQIMRSLQEAQTVAQKIVAPLPPSLQNLKK